MREAALDDDRRGARARHRRSIVAGSDATDHPAIYLDARRRRRHRRRRRGDAGASCSTRSRGAARTAAATQVRGPLLRGARRPRRPHAAARDHPRPRRAAAARPGTSSTSTRYRAIWRRAPRLLLDERGDDARLPVPLQLVREADLRPALHRAHRPSSVVDEMAWLKRTYRPDHLWIADDIFGLKPGLDRAVRRAGRRRATRACPFKCLLRADRRDAGGRRRARARPAAAPCGSAPSRARSGSSTRWRRARGRADRRGDAACCARRASRSASSCSSAIRARRARTSSGRCRWCATAAPDDIGVSVSYPLPGTPFYERVKAQLGAQAELGRLGRPGDDVPRDLPARVLPRAARAGARRVPRARARASRCRAARRPWTLRPRPCAGGDQCAYQRCSAALLHRRLAASSG